MDVVIDLNARRASAPAEPPESALCVCGSGWFEIRAQGRPGAVCLNQDGTVSGYVGVPYCVECGELWQPR